MNWNTTDRGTNREEEAHEFATDYDGLSCMAIGGLYGSGRIADVEHPDLLGVLDRNR